MKDGDMMAAISISKHINVDPATFKATGAFDAVLNIDSRLFIDPHLLMTTSTPELASSYAKVQNRFIDVIAILRHSKEPNDIFWRRAVKLFTFPELEGLCIGYTAKGTSGSGIGGKTTLQILNTAKEIINAGITDPEIFELVGLFEEGVGADRISDMIGRIIAEDLLSYSQRIFTQLGVKMIPIKIGGKYYNSVVNPYNKKPIILVPRDILRDLPVAFSWEDVDVICSANAALREQVNAMIGDTWKKAVRQSKSSIRYAILHNPEILKDLISQYKQKKSKLYDFENDPAGQVIWYQTALDYSEEHPLKLVLDKHKIEGVLSVVKTICDKFKDLIENNGLNSLLFEKEGKPKHEDAAQKLFYGIADAYCKANNLDLSREINGGRGPVDFKISGGYNSRVLVEAKLTSNPQLLHGFSTQIVEYQKAEKTETTMYLVIDVGGHDKRIESLKKLIDENLRAGKKVPYVLFVDAVPKKSASRY